MIQNIVVLIIVAFAACAVAARYMPNPLRQLAWKRISVVAHRHGWSRIARHADMKNQAVSGCGSGCSQCGSCDSPTPRTSEEHPVELHGLMGKNAAK